MKEKIKELQTRESLDSFIKLNGGEFIELKDDEDFQEPDDLKDRIDDLRNTRKKIQIGSLFGPEKARGFLPEKSKKDNRRQKHYVWLARTRYGMI